jgi:epsilon-lactone hydrolase
MRFVAAYLRVTARPKMSTEARAARVIAAPKPTSAAPRWLIDSYQVESHDLDGCLVVTVEPIRDADRVVEPTLAVLYLHGGAYISPMSPQHWKFVAQLVDAGCRVDVPMYGLAPQHTVEEAVPFVERAFERLLDSHRSADITFAGDSAGAGLALAVAQSARGRLPSPARLVLIAPWLDIALSNPDVRAVEKVDPWLTRVGLVEAGRAWLGGLDARDPRASPIYGDMTGLPPIEVVVGTRDLFHPDVLVLQRRCEEAGVDCRLEVQEGAVHVYPLTPTPEGRATSARLVEVIVGDAARP